jgi:Flp pilus assembly protein TadG
MRIRYSTDSTCRNACESGRTSGRTAISGAKVALLGHQARCALNRRAGTTVVESAIVLSLMFSVLFTMFDLGLVAFQSNMLSLAARRLARESIVRGSGVDPTGAWGPAAVSTNASDASAMGQTIKPYCVTMPPAKVTVQIIWLDGTNFVDDRVTTRLTFKRAPMTPMTAWMGTVNLTANATMKILH